MQNDNKSPNPSIDMDYQPTKEDWARINPSVSRYLVELYHKDPEWQTYRALMKGIPVQRKYFMLIRYLEIHNNSIPAKVCVSNYVNALKRGGHI